MTSLRITFVSALAATSLVRAQVAKPPSDAFAEPLVKSIAEISAKDDPNARDYARIANATIDFARRKTQGGDPLNRNVIESGLDAVDAGEKRDRKAADWPKLRDELKAFLEEKDKDKPPPEDKDKQDPSSNESGEGEKKPDDQSSQKSKADSQKKPGESSKENEPKDGSEDPTEKSSDPSTKQDHQKANSNQNSPEKPPKDPASAFGDMKENRPTAPPGKPEQTPSDTQKVGGQNKKDSQQEGSANPRLAVPLQKLDQLKQQDAPAKLFRLMEGQRAPDPAKKGKDW